MCGLNGGRTDTQRNLLLLGTVAERTGNLSYYLNASLGHNIDRTPSFSTEQFEAPDGQVVQLRDKHNTVNSRSTTAACISA